MTEVVKTEDEEAVDQRDLHESKISSEENLGKPKVVRPFQGVGLPVSKHVYFLLISIRKCSSITFMTS